MTQFHAASILFALSASLISVATPQARAQSIDCKALCQAGEEGSLKSDQQKDFQDCVAKGLCKHAGFPKFHKFRPPQ
jgi:hypothetical protein